MLEKEILNQKKEMIFDYIASEEYIPVKFKEMAGILQVPKRDKEDFRQVIDTLVAEGRIQIDSRGLIRPAADNVKRGLFSGTAKGFGFVTVEGEKEDIFIPEDASKGAMHGDTVQIEIYAEKTGKRKEGRVLTILERGTDMVVGTFHKSKNFGFVVPDNQKLGTDIFIPKEHTKGAVTGHKVVAQLISYGSSQKSPEGKIVEILGHVNDPGVDIMSIIKAFGLPEEYPAEVMKQVEKVKEEVDSFDIAGRCDIRDWQMVTIDGEDAKDLDDAITLTKEDGIYHLGVHIADVSHYVQENTPLDKEALKRGTSVYLVDRVIPMLPHKLSNGICSLNAGVDRLALSCFMDIDEKGTVVSHRIAESVVRVSRRMSYTSVKKIIEDKDPAECEEYKELVPMFLLMEELADILRKKRHQRGSIDFDFPESKIYLDDKGCPTDIQPYERNKATKIIEDFMLIANETVAEDYFWQELPFVYRTHDYPDSDKIEKLGIFINNFGYSIRISQDEIHPKELQKLMEKIDGTPEEALISRLTLRSMKQAKYTTDNDGHFGLATKYYCHFTSPIRRYPDLQIHRIIKDNLRRGITEKRREHYAKILPEVATRSSMMERRADEAEREVEKLKKAEYMKQFIGEVFEGVISGLTTWGIYVELPNTVEGMIRVTNLPGDYFYYDEENYVMIGEHTRKTYKLGERILVEVDSVDKILKTIDFIPAEE
ncbi:MAG: ribonuclease R [Acetivibrio ethanolgignens]